MPSQTTQPSTSATNPATAAAESPVLPIDIEEEGEAIGVISKKRKACAVKWQSEWKNVSIVFFSSLIVFVT